MDNTILLRNADLTMYNSMRIHSACFLLYLPATPEALAEILKEHVHQKLVLLGGGSNIIFTKPYYGEDYVFVSTRLLDKLTLEDGIIRAQCGVDLSELAYFALMRGFGGFEFLEDIPGSVGGALMMNAGTYDDTISQLVVDVSYVRKGEAVIHTVSQPEAAGWFFTRDSIFAREHSFVISCGLVGQAGEYAEVLDKMQQIKRKRFMKQPREYPNAGSVFKRPQKDGKDVYVWTLMDELGLRGYRVGDAQVSLKHPGFIVNLGQATCDDMLGLIELCRKTVYAHHQIELDLEWKLI